MEEVKLQEDLNGAGKRALGPEAGHEELSAEQLQNLQNVKASKPKLEEVEQMSAQDMAIELAKVRQAEASLVEVTVQPSGTSTTSAPATSSSSSSSSSGTPANPSNGGFIGEKPKAGAEPEQKTLLG